MVINIIYQELTPNNFLIGNLNENRSSYRVSFYDINIDFDIENKSLDGFVTIKAESKRYRSTAS